MIQPRMSAFLLVLLLAAPSAAAQYEPAGCLRAEEIELADLINDYRASNGLDAVPVSSTLTAVAQWHLADMAWAIAESGEYGTDPSCNLHTWYGMPGAPYSTCCYTSDHAQAACMWDKPAEVSAGSYIASGFEIAAQGYSSPAAALQGWQQSAGHDAVILNQGTWASWTWRAMGVGVDPVTRHYFVWFAQTIDPEGSPLACGVTAAPAHRGPVTGLEVAPNPFNPRTRVEYELDRPALVEAVIHDARGRAVRHFAPVRSGAGQHGFEWSGDDDRGAALPSGVYFLRLVADGASVTRKLALIR